MDHKTHTRLMKDLTAGQEGKVQRRVCSESDYEMLRQHYQFILDDNDIGDADSKAMRMVKRYHEHLFKEYVLGISKNKNNSDGRLVGLRWRFAQEVAQGIGQFTCGNMECNHHRIINPDLDLSDYELDFAYEEDGLEKRALVKIRLCQECLRLFSK